MKIAPFSVTAASLCLMSLASGCLYEIRDEIVDCEIATSNHRRAYATWRRCMPVYESVDHFYDFKYGFIEGYKAAANGGNGCPPTLPPNCYWKVQYQTEDGRAMTNAWFDGYSHGALAAAADGVAEMNRIVTRGGQHDSNHQIVLPDDEHGTPTEMTPADAAEDYSLPPTPVESSPSF